MEDLEALVEAADLNPGKRALCREGRLRMENNKPTTQYFFVGGAPKSGTTWVQRSLDLHPDIVCSGEGHIHEKIIVPMWRMLNEYNIKLQEVGLLVYENKQVIDVYTKAQIIEEIRNFTMRVLCRRTKEGSRIIGDKTPRYYENMRDISIIFPGAKFLMTFRDPRDVAASRIAQAHRSDTKDTLKNVPNTDTIIVSNTIKDWLSSLEKCKQFRTGNPDLLMIARYEDMLISPDVTLLNMFRFLGAPTNSDQISTIVEATSFRHMSGRAPGAEDKASFFRKGIAGDWPNMISPQLADLILESCGSAMRQLGYDV